jgi:excisionase family DNA binding protein
VSATKVKRQAPEPANVNALVATSIAPPDLAWAQSRELMDRIAVEVFKGVVAAVQGALRGETVPPQPTVSLQPTTTSAPATSAPATTEAANDVMTADDVAVFLGVDRNTVYDFAGRGVIPHQRLGKRLLFRRGAIVSWLDSSLCAGTVKRSA